MRPTLNPSASISTGYRCGVPSSWVRTDSGNGLPRVRASGCSGRQYNTLDNTDTNPNVYGGTSTYAVADLKFTYKPHRRSEMSVGVDNLFDERYFVYHPYPGRTFYVQAAFRM